MDDILQIIVTQYLLQSTDITSLLAFVRLQATHRPTWLRYKNDRALWLRLGACLPKWSLPEHLGIRRRVITGIKLMLGPQGFYGIPGSFLSEMLSQAPGF
jgi:hypothetical protein